MYCLIMAIRPDALPTDPAVLTEMVLALDAENEQLRAVVRTLKDMIFGALIAVPSVLRGLSYCAKVVRNQ